MKTKTAHEVASYSELYDLPVSFSIFSKLKWECMGYSRRGITIKFARLVSMENGKIKQVNKYVSPDEICLIWEK